MTIRFSDHALLRFLERVRGIDIEALRWSAAKEVEGMFLSSLTAQAVVKGPHRYVMRNGVVTTVLFADEPWFGALGGETETEKAARRDRNQELDRECVRNVTQARRRKGK